MPTLQDNTIVQNNTTSSQGTNKQPKFDARSHFFLEDEIFTQSAAQAFGVITSANQFRTTSHLNVSNKKLVSICTGQVFIQPQTGNAARVNLILKPYKQPIPGLLIKYFVYRGLPKSDFLDNNDKVLASGSGFITYIRNEFNNFYSQDPNNPAPDFLGKFIGYPDPNAAANESQELTDLIDSYFYKISQTFDNETGPITNSRRAFEMPMIPAGTHLATATGEIGLDIVLNFGDYFLENDPYPFKLNLEYARASEYILNAASITDAYGQKLLRECATWFIDPAAYYGLHANGGSVYKFGQAQPKKTAAEIYTLISQFATKNNIYIYVQSNRQRSYNFYGNYKISDTNSNDIKIGTAEANLAEAKFATDNWPLKVFTTAPAAGAPTQTVAIKFTTDKKTGTILYGAIANIDSPNQENFADASNLVQAADSNGNIPDLTETVILSFNTSNNANVASLALLHYHGKDIVLARPGLDDGDPATPIPIIEYSPNYVSDLFYLLDAVSLVSVEGVNHVHSLKPQLCNQESLDKRKKRMACFTQRTANKINISDTQQLELITYLAIVEAEQSAHSNTDTNVSSNKEATGYASLDETGVHTMPNLPGSEYVDFKTFAHEKQTVTGIELKASDGRLPTTIALGLTHDQNELLKTAAAGTRNPAIFFELIVKQSQEDMMSTNGISFKMYRLGLLVDKPDLKQEIIYPASDVLLYTLDGLLFYTKEYSAYIEKYGFETTQIPEPTMKQ